MQKKLQSAHRLITLNYWWLPSGEAKSRTLRNLPTNLHKRLTAAYSTTALYTKFCNIYVRKKSATLRPPVNCNGIGQSCNLNFVPCCEEVNPKKNSIYWLDFRSKELSRNDLDADQTRRVYPVIESKLRRFDLPWACCRPRSTANPQQVEVSGVRA